MASCKTDFLCTLDWEICAVSRILLDNLGELVCTQWFKKKPVTAGVPPATWLYVASYSRPPYLQGPCSPLNVTATYFKKFWIPCVWTWQVTSMLLFTQSIICKCSYCAFHKHANFKIQKLPSQLRFSLPSIIITITSNEPWNTETHKTDRNPPITDHKPWPFEPSVS